MPEEKKSAEKTIEMRLAELEDKLSKIHITEDELKAFHKVNNMIGGGAGAAAAAAPMEAALDPSASATVCTVCTIYQCIIPRQISRYINRGITPRINRGINECNECGPCGGFGGGGASGGGFGNFGQ